jgi:hypothetical protein
VAARDHRPCDPERDGQRSRVAMTDDPAALQAARVVLART